VANPTRLADLIVDHTNSVDPVTNQLVIKTGSSAAAIGGSVTGQLALQAAAAVIYGITSNTATTIAAALVGVPTSDALTPSQQGMLETLSAGLLFNGATLDRVRSASAANLIAQLGLGAALVAPPGEWDTAPSTPAIGAQATTSRAAGAAGVRHIARRVSFGFSSQALLVAVTSVTFNLRDGATGAGTILKSWTFALPAAIIQPFAISFEVNSPGTAATAMTLETLAAVAGLQVFTNLSGYDAS
jgi:hypothetical protein